MDMRRIFTLGILLLFPLIMSAQSMYSSIGLGEMTLPASNRAAGLGVQGVAVSDYQEISAINPAFWHQLEFTGVTTRMQSTKLTNSSGGLNYRSAFDGFNFHFPIGDVIGVALGFTPLSYVDYDFTRTGQRQFSSLEGTVDTVDYTIDLRGSGGVGGNFIGVGWKVTRRLSIGVAYNLLIGQIENRRTLEFSDQNYSSRYITSSDNVYGGNLILGAAYSNLLRKSDNVGFRVEVPLTMTINSESSVYNSVTTPGRETENLTGLKWPLQMSIGYQTQLTGRWLAVGEANFWMPLSDLDVIAEDNNYTLSNGIKFGAGIEYASDYKASVWWKTLAWRAGISWQKYLVTDGSGNQPSAAHVVTGMGIPFGDTANRLDFSIHYGQRSGFTASDPVETDISFSVGITVSELWFNGGLRNR